MHAIKIISFGKVREQHILEGIREYEKRLRQFCRLEFVELKEEGKDKESEKLLRYSSGNSFVLDSLGKEYTSEEFAGLLKSNDKATFIIGSHDGISPEVKKSFRQISLSRMTFPHEMCRLFFAEQLYRAFMILNNRPYHK